VSFYKFKNLPRPRAGAASAEVHALIESPVIAVDGEQWKEAGRRGRLQAAVEIELRVPSTLVATNGLEVSNRLTSRTCESSDSPSGVTADTRNLGGADVHFRIFRRIVMSSTTGSGSLLRFLSHEYEGTTIGRNLGLYPSNDKA